VARRGLANGWASQALLQLSYCTHAFNTLQARQQTGLPLQQATASRSRASLLVASQWSHQI